MCTLSLPTTRIMSAVGNQVDNSSLEIKEEEEEEVVEEEQRGTKRKISLSSCGVCGSEQAKYRCPACVTHSCSLVCVKKHKEDSGCSGVRNKTAFVTLSHFDEMTLLSDYRFLEDTGRFADSATRDNLVRTPRATFKTRKLGANARKMNITLRFLPVTFTKSRENSTIFQSREKQFLWHVKLMFPQSDAEFSQRRVTDNQTLEQILTAYIHPTESEPVTRQKLKMYVQAPSDHVKVFMKAEGRKANSVRYHELDIQKSLRDNLSYKTLIEYPVLHVVLRDHWKDYPLKGPAEPASACTGFARKDDGLDEKKEVLTQVSPSPQGVCAPGGANTWTTTQMTTSQSEALQEKTAKRGAEEEEQEEGEIIDSSDEEEEEEEEDGNADKTRDDAKCPAEGTEVIKDEVVTAAGSISGSTDDSYTGSESAEVRMTKEDAVKAPEAVHTRHCHDGNESANAADSWELK